MATYSRRRRLYCFSIPCLRMCLAVCILTMYVIIGLSNYAYQSSEKFTSAVRYSSLVEAVSARASPDRYIILAMVDEAFIDMAMNFHEASLRRHRIDNYLFVGVGNSTCDMLHRHSVPCFHYADDPSSSEASEYGNADFIRKMNIRTDMILETLDANFTVLHTDLDVSFLANPLHEIKAVMETSDVAAMWDNPVYNAGFIIIKPTNISKLLYQTVKALTNKSAATDDQVALNNATEMLQRQNIGVKVTVLSRQRFLSGYEYFEKPRRLFPLNSDKTGCSHKDRTNCAVVVHNNWIVSKEAKIYRFREHLMWVYDREDEYYTSSTRLYLTYNNKVIAHRGNLKQMQIQEQQISALKAAMTVGYLLNRTVILPRFQSDRKCTEIPLNSLVHLKTFESEFSGKYRESSFLRHPKVPHDVTFGLHEQKLLVMGKTDNLTRPSRNLSVSRFDVLHQLGDVKAKVLAISGLHNVTVVLENKNEDVAFSKKLDHAFLYSDYRQSKTW